jgi:hypothetical protein
MPSAPPGFASMPDPWMPLPPGYPPNMINYNEVEFKHYITALQDYIRTKYPFMSRSDQRQKAYDTIKHHGEIVPSVFEKDVQASLERQVQEAFPLAGGKRKNRNRSQRSKKRASRKRNATRRRLA